MTRAASFAPVVDAATRVLIVGSLPGQQSLARGQYYAHPRNQFWDLAGAVVGVDLAPLAYAERLAMLRTAGVGLWDVVASATRAGSLDSAIRGHLPNDLAGLIAGLPALLCVGFNGAKAFGLGAAAACGAAVMALPSSSPAYAAMSLAAKRAVWIGLRDYLEPNSL